MNIPGKYALDAAKEITIAAMQSGYLHVDRAGGEGTALFFEAVYNKVKEIADSIKS